MLGSYEIAAAIGAGGMGEVYRARDTKLGRDVAIKVLPEALATPDLLERFEREARAVASLSHPNILAIHDFANGDAFPYVVTELLEGETLRTRLNAGRLSPRKAVGFVIQVCRGLAAAHDKGIIHRDLKPDNIFLTHDGQVKILDFGLAKVDLPETQDEDGNVPTQARGTSAGLVLGTIGYMSPEQLRSQDVDQRSDIFSLGALFYEMLTGERAFAGHSSADTMSAILKDDPPDAGVPAALKRVVHRCVEKDPAERFQSARDLRFTLETLSDVTRVDSNEPTPQTPDATMSVAVLPFKDLSPEKDQDYFCEGMAEEISNALTQVPALRVAAASSAFQFGGKAHDARQVGEALGVSHLLEGSVRTAGTRLRVNAQLVSVADGYHVWSERFDREMEDVFVIQDEIASKIVGALRETFGEASLEIEPVKPVRRHTTNLDAYHLYLKGRHAFERRYRGGPHKAIPFFEQAVALDPGYALAHAGLGDCYAVLGLYGFVPPAQAYAKVEVSIQKALAVDDEFAEVHTTLARLLWIYDGTMDECEREFRRAIELNPSDIQAWCWFALFLAVLRRSDEAISSSKQAMELDPLSPYPLSIHAIVLAMRSGESEETISVSRKALEIDPDHSVALWTLGQGYSRAGEHERAIEVLTRLMELTGRASFYLGLLGWAFGTAGKIDEARSVLAELQQRAASEYVAPVVIAYTYAALGEYDQAMEWLRRAEKERSPFRALLAFPTFDGMRDHPPFRELWERMFR